MKVKILKENNPESLEMAVNAWLKENWEYRNVSVQYVIEPPSLGWQFVQQCVMITYG